MKYIGTFTAKSEFKGELPRRYLEFEQRELTKEESEAHERVIKKRSVTVCKLYDIESTEIAQ